MKQSSKTHLPAQLDSLRQIVLLLIIINIGLLAAPIAQAIEFSNLKTCLLLNEQISTGNRPNLGVDHLYGSMKKQGSSQDYRMNLDLNNTEDGVFLLTSEYGTKFGKHAEDQTRLWLVKPGANDSLQIQEYIVPSTYNFVNRLNIPNDKTLVLEQTPLNFAKKNESGSLRDQFGAADSDTRLALTPSVRKSTDGRTSRIGFSKSVVINDSLPKKIEKLRPTYPEGHIKEPGGTTTKIFSSQGSHLWRIEHQVVKMLEAYLDEKGRETPLSVAENNLLDGCRNLATGEQMPELSKLLDQFPETESSTPITTPRDTSGSSSSGS